jgi:hypothetical protein
MRENQVRTISSIYTSGTENRNPFTAESLRGGEGETGRPGDTERENLVDALCLGALVAKIKFLNKI